MDMLLGSSSSTWGSSIIAGLITAIASVVTSVFITNKQIKSANENARKERQANTLYANQVQWFDSLRKAVADLVISFDQVDDIQAEIEEAKNSSKYNGTNELEYIKELEHKGIIAVDNIHKKAVLIQLYLYRGSDEENDIIEAIKSILDFQINRLLPNICNN